MHHLSNGERAVRFDTLDDRLPGIGLRIISNAGLTRVAL